MKAIILAGGLGTRIKEQYPNTIKSLIRFNEKPFIYYQLGLLKRNNFNEVIICSGYGTEELEKNTIWSDEIKSIGLKKITIIRDGDKLLGTGGAVKNALNVLGYDFLVIYGDSYLDFDYKSSMNKFLFSEKLSLMTIYKNDGKYDKSNIQYKNCRIVSYDKENPDRKYKYIDYGANFFKAEAFFNTPEIFDLADLQQSLLQRNQLACDLIKNRFYEIGSIEGIKEFKEMIKKKNVC